MGRLCDSERRLCSNYIIQVKGIFYHDSIEFIAGNYRMIHSRISPIIIPQPQVLPLPHLVRLICASDYYRRYPGDYCHAEVKNLRYSNFGAKISGEFGVSRLEEDACSTGFGRAV
jgi:hypothetical protein